VSLADVMAEVRPMLVRLAGPTRGVEAAP
jgi:hypothetical protein